MTQHGLTSTQARTVSVTDMVIYNEIDTINRAIITAALAGDLNTSVNDNTTMTESTPTITVTGSVANPTFTPGDQIQLAGQAIALGVDPNDGTGLDQIVADINNANISGLTASANDSNQLVLTYDPPQGSWSLAIGAGTGTANVDIGLTTGTVTATDPASVEYYSVWTGTAEDRKKSYEFAQVVNYFQNLGYNILAKKNTTTGNTFYWEIYW